MGVQFTLFIKIVFLPLAFETLPFPELSLKSAPHRGVGQMILFACWFVISVLHTPRERAEHYHWIGVEREKQAQRAAGPGRAGPQRHRPGGVTVSLSLEPRRHSRRAWCVQRAPELTSWPLCIIDMFIHVASLTSFSQRW